MKYDVMYQEWLAAKNNKDFKLADKIREDFERYHGLTIYAEGRMPIEGATVRNMGAAKWHKKYGDPKVGIKIAAQDSFYRTFLSDIGYHY